ncbi:hypothetical protein EYF80_047882 [Liparis tanakae]|uniref:Uncharacterized protein n=1 Tax=Liparis tanakae TaxID=230148 RepID=A0A4Z2FLQ9_9TELE|nr:hypothetical protein EYF80_047882 [Liparis tanakae]
MSLRKTTWGDGRGPPPFWGDGLLLRSDRSGILKLRKRIHTKFTSPGESLGDAGDLGGPRVKALLLPSEGLAWVQGDRWTPPGAWTPVPERCEEERDEAGEAAAAPESSGMTSSGHSSTCDGGTGHFGLNGDARVNGTSFWGGLWRASESERKRKRKRKRRTHLGTGTCSQVRSQSNCGWCRSWSGTPGILRERRSSPADHDPTTPEDRHHDPTTPEDRPHDPRGPPPRPHDPRGPTPRPQRTATTTPEDRHHDPRGPSPRPQRTVTTTPEDLHDPYAGPSRRPEDIEDNKSSQSSISCQQREPNTQTTRRVLIQALQSSIDLQAVTSPSTFRL